MRSIPCWSVFRSDYGSSPSPAVWFTVAFYTMVGGFRGAQAATVPGFIDLLYYNGGLPPVKKIALTHMAINLSVGVLYAVNIWLRIQEPTSIQVPVILSTIGVCAIAVSGWLGGQMVHVYGVDVEGREQLPIAWRASNISGA
ncbi:MAG: DUF2231 domain-containing protein [Dokdonella sp.]